MSIAALDEHVAEYEDLGCRRCDRALGFASMPPGYALMVDADDAYYFWLRHDGLVSVVHWNRWAVYRGAWLNVRGGVSPSLPGIAPKAAPPPIDRRGLPGMRFATDPLPGLPQDANRDPWPASAKSEGIPEGGVGWWPKPIGGIPPAAEDCGRSRKGVYPSEVENPAETAPRVVKN